jgi:heat shock protein HslJ
MASPAAATALPAGPAATPVAPWEGRWRLAELGGRSLRDVAPQRRPDFSVRGQVIEGFDGCNDFNGRLDQPGSVVATRRACPDAIPLPLDLSDPLAHLRAARVEGNRLVLPGRGGSPGGVFEKEGR